MPANCYTMIHLKKVLDYGIDVKPIVVCYDHFLRPCLKTGSVTTVPMTKNTVPLFLLTIIIKL